MFTSPSDIVAMPCGHYLHHACYTQYLQSAYKCPICKKSAVNMELQWRKLEQEIERQPMPAGLRGQKMEVKCNDCSARSVVPFHWLGCKCGACDGFNTTELRLATTDADARADLLSFVEEERRAQRSRGHSRTNLAAAARVRTQLLQPRDYFASVEDDATSSTTTAADRLLALSLADRLAEHMPNLPNLSNLSPYEMLARMSRSLSPIRHYFNDADEANGGGLRLRIADATAALTDTRSETLSLWGDGAWFFSSGGETDDEEFETDEDEDEGDESENEDDDDDDDDDDDSDDEGELDLRLIGHP
jgi:Zinc-ribbon/Ring finger domain